MISMGLLRESIELARSRAEVDLHTGDDPLPKAELMARLKDKEGLVCQITDTIDAEVLGAAARLKVVANVAVGYNNIDVAAAHRRGIVVTNTPDVLTDTTADFAWVLLMATARRVVEADGYVRAGKWHRWEFLRLLGGDVHAFWVADLKPDFDDPRSPVVATEFVGTSITSQFRRPQAELEALLTDNPHIRFGNGTRRGYLRMEITRQRLRADLRTVRSVTQPGAEADTLATFVVEDGRPGAVRG